MITKLKKRFTIFKNSFFRLSTSQIIAELMMFIQFTILMRGRKFHWLSNVIKEGTLTWDLLPRISVAVHYYMKLVLYLGHVLFALNRLSAAIRPMEYEGYWNSKNIFIARLIQFLLPFVVLRDKQSERLRLYLGDTSNYLTSNIDLFACLLCALICVTIYIIVIFIVQRQSKIMKENRRRSEIKDENNSTPSNSRISAEKRILFTAMALCISLLLNATIQVLTFYGAYKDDEDFVMTINDVSYPIVDAMYSLTPWLLLFTSSAIQRALYKLLCTDKIQGVISQLTGSQYDSVPDTTNV
ncbi:7TM GPCR, serpentine receptor class v (Srv) family-containing protein [Strongyloides ratti]|uniref:7TM GPCR, serpentine receptor class v (Srv) family-containing protein n=1 Tax=Strongyloides ratti TaxID=34506 RepID=A0A090L3H0_STRRB|nr:7TM GPCR, serpentine receptor class v (Srv) family-containing protein [Strongyloides ratti]CEF62044.1 7TM GPCR, serpentine receptor class v (Srv) family-containing protein [Strongyloides ratti]